MMEVEFTPSDQDLSGVQQYQRTTQQKFECNRIYINCKFMDCHVNYIIVLLEINSKSLTTKHGNLSKSKNVV